MSIILFLQIESCEERKSTVTIKCKWPQEPNEGKNGKIQSETFVEKKKKTESIAGVNVLHHLAEKSQFNSSL